MVIPSEKGLDNDIDVYMQSLIDDLKQLDGEELDERLVEHNVDEGYDLFNEFEELVVQGVEANLINEYETLLKNRRVVEKKMLSVTIDLSNFFKRLCAKSLDPQEVDQLQIQVVLTLCEMEKIFSPSLFTFMIHLIIHFSMEAKLGGPIQYRSMYSIERAHCSNFFIEQELINFLLYGKIPRMEVKQVDLDVITFAREPHKSSFASSSEIML
ncbi:hypothetical protein J1N35_022101 [Gossypium stocksii]|uniref:DUF4218 domain-containing protein n=1 Tax=Gossypium stocksii TaxID=47602 RepID=A0A9D3VFG0_9ROSI|nr:hypothetical protein J1N35_022101 [Gossypium stocksii]